MSISVYIEVTGAENHPACAPRGPLKHVGWVNCTPGVTPADVRINARAVFARRPEMVSVAAGVSLNIGQMEDSETGQRVHVGPTDEQVYQMYAAESIDFRRRFTWPYHPATYTGSEFDNVAAMLDEWRLADPNYRPILYWDWVGEAALDYWNDSHKAIRDRLGWTTWNACYFNARSAANMSVRAMLNDCGAANRIIIAGAARPDRPCHAENGQPQPRCYLAAGQLSHLGFYGEGHLQTARCVAAKCAHTVTPYAVHLQMSTPDDQLDARLREGVGALAIVFGDTLDRLPAIAEIVRGAQA